MTKQAFDELTEWGAVAVIAALMFIVALLASPAGAQTLPHGIPNLCTGPTITASANGNWSSAATWTPARVPAAGDKVSIPSGRAVTYDVVSDAILDCLGVSGALTWRTNINTRLVVGNFLILSTGAVTVGSASAPIQAANLAEIIIADRPLNPTLDPEQYGTSILAFGGLQIAGSPLASTFTRTLAEPLAGATTIALTAADLVGWRPGDTIVVPDTRQLLWSDHIWDGPQQLEERTIASVTGSGLTLTQPLTYNHKGNTDATHPDFLPHVANLTRNVIIRSANPSGTRGHVLATERANVDIRYALFKDLGRTTYQPLDSWFQGHTPTNQIGRYPLHIHHVYGPTTPPANGYQFTLIGNAITQGSKWAIAIHKSSFGLIQDNVGYDVNGAVFVTEDGDEVQNVFNHNFAIKCYGEGGREAGGREGTAFWFRGVDNIVTNNVAANIWSNSYDSAYGYKYFVEGTGWVYVPNFPGADLTVPANVTLTNANGTPIRKFENNEVYGATEAGMTFWWIGTVAEVPVANMPVSVIKGLRVWNVFNRGIFHYPANHILVDGLVIRGSLPEAGANGLCCQLGVDFGDYYGKDITYTNFDIQNRTAGFSGSILSDDSTVRIEHGYLKNQIGITVPLMSNISYSAEILRPRHYRIDDVKIDQLQEVDRFLPSGPIVLGYSDAPSPAHGVTLLDEINVMNFNKVTGDNFRVYYAQQAPAFEVPISLFNGDGTRYRIGAPVAGLTNAQTWAQYGVAVGGAVAPCSTTRPEVLYGFVCPTGITPPQPPGSAVVTH